MRNPAFFQGTHRHRRYFEGLMNREIVESISALVSVKLTNRAGEVLYEGTSGEAGMEICLEGQQDG